MRRRQRSICRDREDEMEIEKIIGTIVEMETLQENRLRTVNAELLAALQRCDELSEAAIMRGCDPFVIGQIGEAARAAIDKATGGDHADD
jgi:hypothetical protein